MLTRLVLPVSLLLAGSGCGSAGSESSAESSTESSTGELSCDGHHGEGYDIGQVSNNWTLADADGELHELYEFCGRPIYIEDTAAW